MTEVNAFLEEVKREVEQDLSGRINALATYNTRLHEAMRYSLLLGGKRLRPALVFAAAHAVSDKSEGVIDCACAIEAIHTYSLIHDDLPAMDDDDLRRGQPSCHKAFDEAQAILAGDALQAIAFTWLVQSKALNNTQKIAIIDCLAHAAGAEGMVQGQAMDLEATDETLSLPALEQMHHLKTGALISAAVNMGAICAQAAQPEKSALKQYAQAIGLAFQVQDDILDVTSTTSQLGKQVGSDASLNKPTYVTLLGVEGAQRKSHALIESALEPLSIFGERANILHALAQHIIKRLN